MIDEIMALVDRYAAVRASAADRDAGVDAMAAAWQAADELREQIRAALEPNLNEVER